MMTFGRSQYGLDGSSGSCAEDVERGAAEAAVAQRLDQRLVVHQLAARDVHEQRARASSASICARPISRLVSGVCGAARTTTSLCARRSGRRSGVHTASTPSGGGLAGAAADRGDAKPERRRDLHHLHPDGAEADDAHALAVQRARGSVFELLLRPAMLRLRRSVAGSWRASAIVTPSTCSAIERARMPRALVSTTALASSSGNIRLPTPTAGLCTQRSRDADGKTSRSTNGVKATSASGSRRRNVVAIPGVEERVLRKVGAQPIDVAAAASPTPAPG